MLDSILTSWGVRFLRRLQAIFFKRLFPKGLLEGQTKIDVRPRNDSVAINVESTEVAWLTIWLEVANQTDFHIELDRIFGEFDYGTRICKVSDFSRISIKRGETISVVLSCELSAAQLSRLANQYRHQASYICLRVQAEFNAQPHNYTVSSELSGLRVSFTNERLLQNVS